MFAVEEESPLYDETYALVRLVREVLLASGNAEPHLVASAWSVVGTLRELVTDALRLRDEETVMRRLRDAEIALEILRRDLYDMLRARVVSTEMFDEVMRGCARTRDAVCRRASSARQQAWARLCGHPRPRLRKAARA